MSSEKEEVEVEDVSEDDKVIADGFSFSALLRSSSCL
jgi:hypothetical protein